MRAAKWFIIGTLAGGMLSLLVVAVLYLSPWRQSFYLHADPKVSAVREKLGEFRRLMQANEERLSLGDPALGNDSLQARQATQARLWKEYKVWRERLGDMAKAHAATSPAGFVAWAASLLVFVLPGSLFLSLVCGLAALFIMWRMEEKQPVFTPPPRRAMEPNAAPEALDQFQEAVRRIADIQARSPVRQRAAQQAQKETGRIHAAQPEIRLAERVVSPFAKPPFPIDSAQPEERLPAVESLPLPPSSPGVAASTSTSDTTYLDVLAGWEEMAQTPAVQPPQAQAAPATSTPWTQPRAPEKSLIMQDEDAALSAERSEPAGSMARAADALGDNPYDFVEDAAPLGRMPETTEFEKLDRQKDEVVKLTRKGLTSSEISRRLKISQDQVELIIRMRRERGSIG